MIIASEMMVRQDAEREAQKAGENRLIG